MNGQVQCTECDQKIEDNDDDIFAHVEEKHGDEVFTKDQYIMFIERNIVEV